MQPVDPSDVHHLSDARRRVVRRWGKDSWAALGVIALVVVVFYGLGLLGSIVVPVTVAVILGVLTQPLVNWMENHGVARSLAATTVLLLLQIAVAGLIALTVWGVAKQLPEMSVRLFHGWESFINWVQGWDVDGVWLERMRSQLVGLAPSAGAGIAGAVAATVSSTLTFLVAAFFSIFVLFFVLRDGRNFPNWLARTVGYDPTVVQQVAGATTDALQGYFRSTALTALITAPIFIIPLLILRVPLVIPIFLLYFFLSFIPYLGAFATGIFAVLIAFGSHGATAALIVLVSLLISNGAIQNAVLSWTMGSSLDIHPVTVLIATMVGGVLGGMLGMILGAPLAAAFLKSSRIVRNYEQHRSDPQPQDPLPAT